MRLPTEREPPGGRSVRAAVENEKGELLHWWSLWSPAPNCGAKLRYGPGQVALAGSNRRLQKNVCHPLFDPIQNEVDRPLLSRADSFAGGRKKVEPVVYSRAQIARLIPQIYRCGAGFSE